MSTKKLIQEISMMTHKGIYPSLNILLEKDEGDETSAEMGDEVLDAEDATKEKEEGSESEESDETETSDETEAPDETEESGEDGDDDNSIDKLELDRLAGEIAALNAAIDSKTSPTGVEQGIKESFRKSYFNLKKFSLLQEDSSSIVADLQDVLSQFEEKNGFGLGDIKDEMLKGEDVDLDFMLDQAKAQYEKPFDVALSILEDKLETIRLKADPTKPKETEELQIKFIEMFEEYCRKNNIDITIPEKYKKMKPTKYNSAQGAVKSG